MIAIAFLHPAFCCHTRERAWPPSIAVAVMFFWSRCFSFSWTSCSLMSAQFLRLACGGKTVCNSKIILAQGIGYFTGNFSSSYTTRTPHVWQERHLLKACYAWGMTLSFAAKLTACAGAEAWCSQTNVFLIKLHNKNSTCVAGNEFAQSVLRLRHDSFIRCQADGLCWCWSLMQPNKRLSHQVTQQELHMCGRKRICSKRVTPEAWLFHSLPSWRLVLVLKPDAAKQTSFSSSYTTRIPHVWQEKTLLKACSAWCMARSCGSKSSFFPSSEAWCSHRKKSPCLCGPDISLNLLSALYTSTIPGLQCVHVNAQLQCDHFKAEITAIEWAIAEVHDAILLEASAKFFEQPARSILQVLQ